MAKPILQSCKCVTCVKFDVFLHGRDSTFSTKGLINAPGKQEPKDVEEGDEDGYSSYSDDLVAPSLLSTKFRSTVSTARTLNPQRLDAVIDCIMDTDILSYLKGSPSANTEKLTEADAPFMSIEVDAPFVPTAEAPFMPTEAEAPFMPIEGPFHHILFGTWLYHRPDRDVDKLLIDTYRVQLQENPAGARHAGLGGNGNPSFDGFVRFLHFFENKRMMFPPFWNIKRIYDGEWLGRKDGWTNLKRPIDVDAVNAHYGDDTMLMQMKAFGHLVSDCGERMGRKPSAVYEFAKSISSRFQWMESSG
ncbi:hypothetical protein P152DRAFT_475015 [Eremomyces bilateralis CBS 781.70]|uniref:Uncharacterized protein n=1 Tax=Eremomyces bilateralis CBS 781.70 TaxID=1392243 RepID=A0A6G1FZ04_9PEZI|nr:uncharacterized protein P152DRAFT_475015 [Eremomyces bilateralis CBS 781.70]KAF1810952.1 hypothetical protein P152DRAFT_475015 [Eremomyces bilateralis CBS 781.70]